VPSVDWNALYGYASSQLGTPYVYGATGNGGYDCSGFTQAVYASQGIQIGRDTTQQLQSGQMVGQDGNWAADIAQLQPGDLIFYGQPGASGPNAHVVMYIGNGQVIQAGGSNVNVTQLFQSAASDEPFLGVRRYTSFTNAPAAGQPTEAASVNPAGPNPEHTLSNGQQIPMLNTAPVSPTDQATIDQSIQQNYPSEVWMLGIPELRTLLEESVANGWSQQQFQAQLQQTDWWKTTSGSVVNFLQLQSSNPAELDFNAPGSQANQKYQDILVMAAQHGVNLSQQQAQDLAINAIKYGWDANQMQGFIATYVQYGNGVNNAQSVIQQLQGLAGNYLYTPSQQALQQWATGIAGGTQTTDQYTAFLQQQAMLKYPGMADMLQQGFTPQQIVDPLRQEAAKTMEISPDQIDFVNDPTYSKVLQYVPPGQTAGQPQPQRMMTTSEMDTYLRGTKQWGYTQQARNQVGQLANGILSTWGVVAGTGGQT